MKFQDVNKSFEENTNFFKCFMSIVMEDGTCKTFCVRFFSQITNVLLNILDSMKIVQSFLLRNVILRASSICIMFNGMKVCKILL